MSDDSSEDLKDQEIHNSSKMHQAEGSNSQKEQKPHDQKDYVYSFFNRYKSSTIFIGIAFLVAILLIIYFVFISKPKEQAQIPIQLPNAILIINEPQNEQATTTAEIKISGRTNPDSQVVAYTDTNENIFESDMEGNFSGVLVLEEGPNEITITAFGNKDEEVTETRSVVYVLEGEL